MKANDPALTELNLNNIQVCSDWQFGNIVVYSSVRDSYHLKSHKNVCITTYQPDAKSNPNPNPVSTTKQQAVVNIQLNVVTCPRYQGKFIRDMLLRRLCDFRL